MSKFTEEWQRVRKDIGHMVGVMESMAVKYGDCTEIEAKAYEKGKNDGFNACSKKQKQEYCAECNDKIFVKNCNKYADLLMDFDKLDFDQQDIIYGLIGVFRDGGRG